MMLSISSLLSSSTLSQLSYCTEIYCTLVSTKSTLCFIFSLIEETSRCFVAVSFYPSALLPWKLTVDMNTFDLVLERFEKNEEDKRYCQSRLSVILYVPEEGAYYVEDSVVVGAP